MFDLHVEGASRGFSSAMTSPESLLHLTDAFTSSQCAAKEVSSQLILLSICLTTAKLGPLPPLRVLPYPTCHHYSQLPASDEALCSRQSPPCHRELNIRSLALGACVLTRTSPSLLKERICSVGRAEQQRGSSGQVQMGGGRVRAWVSVATHNFQGWETLPCRQTPILVHFLLVLLTPPSLLSFSLQGVGP